MGETEDPAPSDRGKRADKVGHVLEDYGLADIDAKLVRLWTGNGEQRSLRELADYINRQLLGAAMEAAGAEPLDGEVRNMYRLLADDDVDSGARARARRRLERDGLDVDALKGDFVTHQAVHTYLTKYRDASHARASSGTTESASRTIHRLKNRLVAVTEKTLETLRNNGTVALGEFDAIVAISVRCTECDKTLPVQDLLANGGCYCRSDEER